MAATRRVPHTNGGEPITSTANERVKHVRALHRGEVRRRERAFLVEGVRLVEEALRAGWQPQLVLANPDLLARTPRGRKLLGDLRSYPMIPVSEHVLEFAADTVTPQGVVAVVPYPEAKEPAKLGLLVLVLDGLRDPGNLGTILRAAEASGVETVILTPDCVDVYSPKVVRAAMGAHFRLGLLPDRQWPDIERLLGGRDVWLAAARTGQPYYDVDWTRQAALIVGSEAHGAGEEARRLATDSVHIPMAGAAESLNAAVAASVILFEALRQRLTKSPLPLGEG